jgi:hypothetical protein
VLQRGYERLLSGEIEVTGRHLVKYLRLAFQMELADLRRQKLDKHLQEAQDAVLWVMDTAHDHMTDEQRKLFLKRTEKSTS